MNQSAALDIARELLEERERHFSLASAIRLFLEPAAGRDAPSSCALRLVEVLEELLADSGQARRLIDQIAS